MKTLDSILYDKYNYIEINVVSQIYYNNSSRTKNFIFFFLDVTLTHCLWYSVKQELHKMESSSFISL